MYVYLISTKKCNKEEEHVLCKHTYADTELQAYVIWCGVDTLIYILVSATWKTVALVKLVCCFFGKETGFVYVFVFRKIPAKCLWRIGCFAKRLTHCLTE